LLPLEFTLAKKAAGADWGVYSQTQASAECPLLSANRTCGDGGNDVNDPKRT